MNSPHLDSATSPHFKSADIEFRREVIYFIVLDRFHNGNPSNLKPDNPLNDPTHQDWDKYWGGDLQGVLDKLDYLQETGVTAIWLTPLFEQVEGLEEDKSRAPIHGYWPLDFKRINKRWLNDPSEASLFQCENTLFDRLIQAIHDRGMKFVLDIVCNHSSPATGEGKGKLYDDGELVADFEKDIDHWYHHYGGVTDWDDEWQVQNKELGGLATFNENNIKYRRYIKSAIKLWLSRDVDALRIDTVKHMPLWFWQEFTSDIHTYHPQTFIFGEWINNHPDNERSVEYANKNGMNLLDFGLCHAIRSCLGEKKEEGFNLVQEILSKDRVYRSASEMVTFIENHDMPRFLNLNPDKKWLHLALVLLLTTRGIPCLYYGCEQYLYEDRKGGEDPYNRPMMKSWEMTEARRIIALLSEERRLNPSVQWGGVWPILVENNCYAFLRKYRDSRCLVLLNRSLTQNNFLLENVDFPDGEYSCLLHAKPVLIVKGQLEITLDPLEATVVFLHGTFSDDTAVVHLQVNDVPIKSGERLAIVGNAPEVGDWDLEKVQFLECINPRTWFGEIAFNESAGKSLAYKYVIFPPDSTEGARREIRIPRRRMIPQDGVTKWRDIWRE